MRKINDPFNLEKQRIYFSRKKDYKKLSKLYSPSSPEIEDINTSKLWDQLNLVDRKKIIENPMELERLNYVVKLIRRNNFALLNIGFGSANLEEKFFSQKKLDGIRWYGIDISEKSVKSAKNRFLKCRFETGNILDIKEKDNKFDYVVSLEVLEHIKPSKVFRALAEIFRVLKSNGYFIASVPLNEGLEQMIKRGENPNAHVRIYTPDLIKAELEMAGFTIISQKTIFAFHKYHKIKTFIANHFLFKKFLPNNIIVVAQKP
jgi:2-polyprenyl-3-methyl-5-hydroxy-6-metoxy-1,4-benzoquinol methylase